MQPASFTFRNQPTRGMVSLSPDAPPPVIRGRQGQPMHLRVSNRTPDYTAMHWHGLRIANAMDGVPYLTQMPIAAGESFGYEFTPPDAGTYWYHPHCMTMAQLRAAGRGPHSGAGPARAEAAAARSSFTPGSGQGGAA